MKNLQRLVLPFFYSIFGKEAYRVEVRAARLVEEALELAQCSGLSKGSCHDLVEYVFERVWGDPHQEVGGVMLTLMGLCERMEIDLEEATIKEFSRVLAFDDEKKERMRIKDRPIVRAS